ncbi:MAG TPA: hypothetical protein VGD37_07590 [Kofleriaceae bacterium]
MVTADPPPPRGDPASDVAALRARGPAGLEAMLAHYDHAAPAEREALATDVDAVAGQRYATVSRLYWFTELDRAEAEAHRLHRPILALRMLGDLRDDLSCANSRLFRATLYANTEVSAFLRAHFVLYWSSARAVPKVTIDYGDGRKLVRTTTGNSAHYVLDEDGHVLDVLPGLYAPAVFRRELSASLALADRVRGMSYAPRANATMAYHTAALAAAERDWQRASGTYYIRGSRALPSTGDREAVLARAMAATTSKASIEVPDLQRIGLLRPDQVPRDEAAWGAIGQNVWELYERGVGPGLDRVNTYSAVPPPMVLDDTSRALIARLHNAGPVDQRATPEELEVVLARLEQHIVADTALNQFTLRSQIHRHITAFAATDFAELDAWIYDEVFATPRSDAWLGLLPRSEFTGLPGDGVVMP